MTWKSILSVVIFILAFIGGKLAYNALFSESEVSSFEISDWKMQFNLGVTFEAPFKLSSKEIDLPSNIKPFVKEISNYLYDSKAISFMLSKAVYNEEIITDLDGAVQGAVQNMSVSEGVSDFKYEIINYNRSGLSGRRIEATLKMNGLDAEIIAELYCAENKLLQVMLTNLSYDDNRQVRNRILNSLKIAL